MLYFLRIIYLADVFDSTSIVSGTPPTIHIDSSIRAAPLVLQEINGKMLSSCNCILFGQIDLNLIWEKVS